MKNRNFGFLKALVLGGGIATGLVLNCNEVFAAEVCSQPECDTDDSEEQIQNHSIQKMEDAVGVVEGDVVAEEGYLNNAKGDITSGKMTGEKADEIVANGKNVLEQAKEKNEVVKKEYEAIVGNVEAAKNNFDEKADSANMETYVDKVNMTEDNQEKVAIIEDAEAKAEEENRESVDRLNSLNEELEESEKSVKDAEIKYFSAEADYKSKEKYVDDLETEYEMNESDKNFYIDEINDSNRKLEELSKNENVENNIKIVKERVSILTNEISEIEKRLIELSKKIEEANDEDKPEIREAYEAELQKYGELKSDLSAYEKALETHKKTYEERIIEYNEAKKEYDAENEKYLSAKEEYDKLVVEYEKLAENLELLEADIKEMEIELSSLKADVENNENEIGNLDEKINSGQALVEKSRETISGLEKDIERVALMVEEAIRRMDDVQSKIEKEENVERCEALRKEYYNAEKDYDKYSAELKTITESLETNKKEYENLTKTIEGYKKEQGEKKEVLEIIKSKYKDLGIKYKNALNSKLELKLETEFKEVEKISTEGELYEMEERLKYIYGEALYEAENSVNWYRVFISQDEAYIESTKEEIAYSEEYQKYLLSQLVSESKRLAEEYSKELSLLEERKIHLVNLKEYEYVYSYIDDTLVKLEGVLEKQEVLQKNIVSAQLKLRIAQKKLDIASEKLKDSKVKYERIQVTIADIKRELDSKIESRNQFIEAAENYKAVLELEMDARELLERSETAMKKVASAYEDLDKIIADYKETQANKPVEPEVTEVSYKQESSTKIYQKVKDIFTGFTAVIEGTIKTKSTVVVKTIKDTVKNVTKTVVATTVNVVATGSMKIYDRFGRAVSFFKGNLNISLSWWVRFFS